MALRWLSGSGRCLGPAPPRIRAREKHRSDRRSGPWPRSQQMDSGGVARRSPTLSRAFFTCVAHRARSAVALDPCGSKLEEPSSGLHECTFGRQRNRMNRQPGCNNEFASVCRQTQGSAAANRWRGFGSGVRGARPIHAMASSPRGVSSRHCVSGFTCVAAAAQDLQQLKLGAAGCYFERMVGG